MRNNSKDTRFWWAEMPNTQAVETAWENSMGKEGMERYELSRNKDHSQTNAGQKLIRKLLERSVKAVERVQKEVFERSGYCRTTRGTVLQVPAETTAILALRVLIHYTYSAAARDKGVRWQSACVAVGKAIEGELNFRNWLAASKDNAEAYRQAKGLEKAPMSFAERTLRDNVANRQNLSRWRQSYTELSEFEWDEDQLHWCGDAILGAIVFELSEHFNRDLVSGKGKKSNMLYMSNTLLEQFERAEIKAAEMSVVKKPMLAKPLPWKADGSGTDE